MDKIAVLRHRSLVLASIVLGVVATATAHTDQDQGYYGPGMMWSDGGWMHNSAHMVGYNMWGMGWAGVIFGLAFWILAGLGAYHLYQYLWGDEDERER